MPSGEKMIKGHTHKGRAEAKRVNMELTRKSYHLGTKNLKGLADIVGVTPGQISKYLAALGLSPENAHKRGPKRGDKLEIDKVLANNILDLNEQGCTVDEISEIWKISKIRVKRVINGTAKIT